ncbi:MAG TPA: NosD domain-containing protein [Methanothrix sp.]|nr:NosD domain-containing protein [Methanothrix sp.]HPJ83177.1 NosD domain-containing protein [Methanothrix sp.]
MANPDFKRMILVIYLASAMAQGATITVCPSGCDYSSIKAAIFVASPGDVVEIQSGRYYEHLKIDKEIELRGVDSGKGIPILDATGSGSPVTVSADGVVVEGLRLLNGGPDSAGILVLSDECVIRNNDASNNYVGIHLVGSRNCTVQGNVASGNLEYGLRLDNCLGNLIYENQMTKNFLENAFDDGSNLWDNGSVGNMYGDFDGPDEGCTDDDEDGLCDSGREIPGGSNRDRFPLAGG